MGVIQNASLIFFFCFIIRDVFGQINVGRPLIAAPKPALVAAAEGDRGVFRQRPLKRDVVQEICGVSRGGNGDPFQLQVANVGIDIRSRAANLSGLLVAPTIVGGVDSQLGEVCWQAKLARDGFFICGGSIIGRRTILTATHCVINFR